MEQKLNCHTHPCVSVFAKQFEPRLRLHMSTWRSPSSVCGGWPCVKELQRGLRQWMGVLWHTTEVGNTCSPWAPLAPDLSHSRSQWPSVCLPSCQAALSQTRCKHTDNSLRKPSRERREGRSERHRQTEEIEGREKWKLHGKMMRMKEKEIWWRTGDSIGKGRTQCSSFRKPPVPVDGGREREGGWVFFMSSLI